MRLSLIGMSGAGKSYWAKRMQSQGYRSIICDNLIAEQLGPLISSSEKSTLGLAAWMGKPDQPGYKEAQAKYLELETKVVTQICDELEQSSESDDKVIIDTTGSLIYLEPQLIKRIKKLSFLVYLRLEENSSQSHYQIFIDDPVAPLNIHLCKPRKGWMSQKIHSQKTGAYNGSDSFKNS